MSDIILLPFSAPEALAVPGSGPITMADINAACKLGYNLGAYRNKRFWNFSTGAYVTLPNAPISFANFRNLGALPDWPVGGRVYANCATQPAVNSSVPTNCISQGAQFQWNLSQVDYSQHNWADFTAGCGGPHGVSCTWGVDGGATNGVGYQVRPGMTFRLRWLVPNLFDHQADVGVGNGLVYDACLYSGCVSFCSYAYNGASNLFGFGPISGQFFGRIGCELYEAAGAGGGGLIRLYAWGGYNTAQLGVWSGGLISVTRVA